MVSECSLQNPVTLSPYQAENWECAKKAVYLMVEDKQSEDRKGLGQNIPVRDQVVSFSYSFRNLSKQYSQGIMHLVFETLGRYFIYKS